MPFKQTPMSAYMKDRFPLYLFVFVLFGTGIVFGAVMVGALTLEQKQELSRYLSGFFQTLVQGSGFDESVSFQQALALHMKWIFLIWVLGMSVVGLPLIFALDFLKGVLVGFTVGYLIGQYSWKGALFALAGVVPQNLIIIPAVIVTSVSAISFSLQLVRNRFYQKGSGLYHPFMGYSATTLGMAVLLAGTALYEAFLSPAVMNWVSPMLLGN